MKQILMREQIEYDMRSLFGENYGDTLCDELYEKSSTIKRNLGLRTEPISIQRVAGKRRIKINSIAGILSLKDLEIEIMPKFYNDDDRWRENLFTMISWANSGRIEAQRSNNMQYASRNMYDHIGRLYAEELEFALRKEILRSYRSVEDCSRFLRGRLLLNQEVQHVLATPGIVWYEHDVYDHENEFNYLLKWCAEFLFNRCHSRLIKNKLREVGDRIPTTKGYYNIPITSKLPVQYGHYAKAVEVANNVARGSSMQHGKQGYDGYGYIVDTEVIYEKFIEKILSSLREYKKDYLSQAQVSLHFAIAEDKKMPSYYTVPDNKIQINGRTELLIDAKYKDNFKAGTRKKPVNSDVYQLFSSLVAHGCTRGILISPCDVEEKEGARYWSINNNGKAYYVSSLCINLKDISTKKNIDDLRTRMLAYIDELMAFPKD